MSLSGRKILVGLTGGIACYKVPYLIRALIKAEAEVRVIMTEAATKFITPLTLETISGNPVATTMFPDDQFVSTRHIDLATWSDLIVIAPATANFLGKAANGICDDLLSAIFCASPSPVLIVPAMNPAMWQHRPTQKNRAYLAEIGCQFIGPASGEMACDHWGEGRMVEPDQIFAEIESLLTKSSKKKLNDTKVLGKSSSDHVNLLSGRKILVTAGPCREPIDPVRYLSNRSSGKMGFALAEAARNLGATVTLVSGPTSIPDPDGIETVRVETTQDMYRAVSARFARIDCLIMAAAPADFRPTETADQKIKKDKAGRTLALKPTIDILARVGARKKKQFLVGFALETENGLAHARKKLKAKNLDMIVLNSPCDPHSGFDHDTNQLTIIRPGRKAEAYDKIVRSHQTT
jgi:phosphopantothenoylcysteine decarboxylase/phosphopantothenate--cysteine ligase